MLESLLVARIRELDCRLGHVATATFQNFGHGVDQLLGLAGVGEVDEEH